MGLVSVSVVGNVVRDPVRKEVTNGTVTTITLAVDRWKSDQGEGSSDFYDVEVWGRLADIASKYIHKGNQIAAVGRLAQDRWKDRDGQNRTTMVVHADQISLPPKPRSNENTNDSWRNKQPTSDSDNQYDYASTVPTPSQPAASSPEQHAPPQPETSTSSTHTPTTPSLEEQTRGDTTQTDEFQYSEEEEANPAPTSEDAAALFGGAPTAVPA
jgi:single-strand DNA-binding protein